MIKSDNVTKKVMICFLIKFQINVLNRPLKWTLMLMHPQIIIKYADNQRSRFGTNNHDCFLIIG